MFFPDSEWFESKRLLLPHGGGSPADQPEILCRNDGGGQRARFVFTGKHRKQAAVFRRIGHGPETQPLQQSFRRSGHLVLFVALQLVNRLHQVGQTFRRGGAALLPALQANTDDHYSYLIGFADGTVRPNGKITRAEVATIFFRLLDDDTRAKYWSSENNFSDVSADKWYNNAVSTLSRMGVIGGYADGTFRPDAPISRAEFAKIAVSFTQNNGSAVYNYFTDVKTTDWFAPYVTAAKDGGLIEGYSDGSFKPESKITRAEACAIVNRTLGRKPSKAHMKISDRIDWPDVQTTDWFYEAIMEATNSHTCTMGDRVETWTGKLPQRDWATLETGWANAYTGR